MQTRSKNFFAGESHPNVKITEPNLQTVYRIGYANV